MITHWENDAIWNIINWIKQCKNAADTEKHCRQIACSLSECVHKKSATK